MRQSNLVSGTTVLGRRRYDGSTRAPGAAGGEGRAMGPGATGTADRRSDSATRVELSMVVENRVNPAHSA